MERTRVKCKFCGQDLSAEREWGGEDLEVEPCDNCSIPLWDHQTELEDARIEAVDDFCRENEAGQDAGEE